MATGPGYARDGQCRYFGNMVARTLRAARSGMPLCANRAATFTRCVDADVRSLESLSLRATRIELRAGCMLTTHWTKRTMRALCTDVLVSGIERLQTGEVTYTAIDKLRAIARVSFSVKQNVCNTFQRRVVHLQRSRHCGQATVPVVP